jgi:hypothetical protein
MKRFYLSNLTILLVTLLGWSLSVNAQSTSFSYTGSMATYIVPAGVTSLYVDMAGGGGGYDYEYPTTDIGGAGGRVTCNLTVTPGQVLYITVGQAGPNGVSSTSGVSGGFNGGGAGVYEYAGGGGGASDIRVGGAALAQRIVVAGAGGGAGYDCGGSEDIGGAGGGLIGGTGKSCNSGYLTSCDVGGAGSQTAGGAVGSCDAGAGAGSLGTGGAGGTYFGGGGGGGYYGGAGTEYGGGGGGSSYTSPSLASNVVNTQGYQTGNGYINICAGPVMGAITGSLSICPGTSTTLSDPTSSAPGTWSTSSPYVTVGATTGVVTGISANTAVISYTVVNSCTSGVLTTTVLVNPNPPGVTGLGSICPGTSITLSDASTGGTWSSSAPAIATIGSSSGVASGVSVGMTVITYTATTGCQVMTSVAVNAPPAAHNITGGGTYCPQGGTGIAIGLNGSNFGTNYQLYDAGMAEGTSMAGTGAALSFGSFTPVGIYTVLATTAGSGCTTVMTGTAPVAAYAPLTIFSVTGGGSYCAGGAGTAIGLSGSTSGVSYRLYHGVSASGAAVMGTGGVITFGTRMDTGTRTVIATNTTTGCSVAMAGTALVNINPVPPTFNLTTPDSTTSYCAGGSGVHIGLNGSTVGVTYQLQNGGTTLPAMVSGMGGPISLLATSPGVYTIVGSYPTGCSSVTTTSATVNTIAIPTAYPVTGSGGYCSGGAGRAIGLSYSALGYNYQLYNGGTAEGSAIAGTNGSITFGVWPAGNYTVVASGGGCSNNMSGTANVTINALPVADTISDTGMSAGMYCPGATVPGIRQSGSSIGANYQLYNGATAIGTAVAGTGAPIYFTSATGPGSYTVMATNATTGCSIIMTGSATLNTYVAPTLNSVTGGGGYCVSGTGVAIGVSPSSDLGVNYQLYNGATLAATMAGTGGTFNFANVTVPGTYTVVAVNATNHCVTNLTGDASVTINPLPETFMVTGGGGYCANASGAPVNLSYSTVGVNYQLYNNGIALGSPIGGTGGTLAFGPQTNTGHYTVVATNASTTCTDSMTGMTVVTVNPLPAAYAVSGTGNFCAGGAGLPVSVMGSTGGVLYQLYNGAVPVGPAVAGTGGTVNFGLQSVGGSSSVIATNAVTTCSDTMTGVATITVNAAPVVHTVTGGGSFCIAGTGANVGLDSSDAGVSYMLYRGGVLLSTMTGTGSSFNFGSYSNVGIYTVEALNTMGCISNMSGEATITMLPLPLSYTVTGGGSFCAGGTGAHVELSSSTTGVTYYLMNSAMPGTIVDSLSGTGSLLNFGPQAMTGTYTVMATNATTGCVNNMSSSAMITINALPDTFMIMPGGSYCEGGLGIDVKLAGSTSGVNYQLYYDGSAVGLPFTGGGAAVDFGYKTAPGTYTVTAINPVTGCTNTMTSNAMVAETPIAVPGVTVVSPIPATVCAGTSGDFTATTVNGGSAPAYQWMINGVDAGTDSAGFNFTPADGQVVTVKVTSNAPCAMPASVTSAPVTFSVIADHTPSVAISSTSTDVCQGSGVFFTATPTYGGTAATYTWIKDNVVIGTGTSLTYNALPSNGDSIFVVLTSSYPCISGSDSAISSRIGVTVAAALTPYVTVTANPGNDIKMGTQVTFAAHATGAGSAPAYQWSVNGAPVAGAVDSLYTTTSLNNGDNVTCSVTGSNICGTNTASSNNVVISVENTTGVQVLTSSAGNVKLLPNPNKGDFIVKGTLNTTGQQTVAIEVTNMLGQVIYKENVVTVDGKINEHIQLAKTLASGVYMLNLSTGTDNTVFHFVVE